MKLSQISKFSVKPMNRITKIAAVLCLIMIPFTAYGDYWTGWDGGTSSSSIFPPEVCEPGDLVSGVRCLSSYCSFLSFRCRERAHTILSRYWTGYFSEESSGNGNWHICANEGFVTGFDITGKYGDNIAIECSTLQDYGRKSCSWSAWHSEEQGYLYFPYGKYVAGFQCSGSYCDNKRFYICNKD